MRIVNIYLWKLANSSDIEFEFSHPEYQTHVQQHFIKPGSLAEIKLLRPLFNSDGYRDKISADDPRTAKDCNNIAVILLALFVLWDQLQVLFANIGTTNDNYS